MQGDTKGWFDLPDELQERILASLSLIYLSVFSIASSTIWAVVRQHVRERVNGCLVDFDLPVDLFREMMRTYMAVISGSAVLRIIEPSGFEPGDLDVYVPRGAFGAVDRFLTTQTNYVAAVLDGDGGSTQLQYLAGRYKNYTRGIAKSGEHNITSRERMASTDQD